MNPTSISDIEARWRPLTAQEATNASTFIDDAWWMLTARRPALEQDIAAGTIAEGNVIRVVAAMVIRIMRNPDGYSSETVDDYTYRRDALVASGALTVTDAELADLTPSGSRRRVRSVRLVTSSGC